MLLSDSVFFIITAASMQGKHNADENQHANPLVADEGTETILTVP
jgi:hypothetical protein